MEDSNSAPSPIPLSLFAPKTLADNLKTGAFFKNLGILA